MASTSKMATDEAQEEEEELERFDDFTLASSWERFISEIEAVCRQWLADGPKNLLEKGAVHLGFSNNLYRVKSELKYATKNYLMEYYFGRSPSGQYAEWDFDLHDLQLSFGVNEFLVIAPQSASGVVLDAPEASKLLSAVAIALTNCSSLWPAFVPVHDPSRKAFIGIQNMGTIFTRRFEADLIGSQVPVKLMHLEGLYELFVSKFAFSEFDFSMHLFKVHFTMRLTYRTVPHNADDDSVEAGADVTEHSNNIRTKMQWDDDCPWSEWYSAEDPVRGFELISIWAEKIVESSLEMAELENSSPHEAVKWILVPSLTHHFENTVGFASQLRFMVDALNMSFEAQFMEDFVSVESSGADNPKSTTVIPPPSVLDRVLKDIFHEELKLPDFAKCENKNSRAIKGAHFKSLFAQFCLHSLWFGNCNIRAIAVMWIEFVREVRWYWEESQPLPKMPANGVIDLTTCLINQKLHMLAICIEKKRQLNQDYQDSVESEDYASVLDEEEGQVEEDLVHIQEFRENFDGTCDSLYTPEATSNPQVTSSRASSCPENESSANFDSVEHTRRGSAGVVGSMMLLNLRQNMHSPYTQDAPLMTEDMHEERLKAVEAFGNSFSFSAQLERDILTSDMSAFKAANPDAVFEDFIRWHSPGDWEDCVTDQSGAAQGLASEQLKENWPPRGRLSQRMSEHGNRWRKLWDEAPALPASVQKPLFDPNQEGEKILHYLETLRPHQLLEQMVCTTFRASADTLDQTKYGRLRQMLSKIDQLYLTIASALKPLQLSHISDDSETIEDLRRLCTVFGHVEKLLSVAASLHRKFLQAPRLSEEIFSEYYKFHLPKMGTSSMEVDVQKEFDMKQLVSYEERHIVANMFVQPTANQSWRKVLSMGNLLNGHEPVLREIIFSTQETTNVNHYASGTSAVQNQEVETFRMYICGTSNDLQVALSVSSCD